MVNNIDGDPNASTRYEEKTIAEVNHLCLGTACKFHARNNAKAKSTHHLKEPET